MSLRRIAVVTGSRADYGGLGPLLDALDPTSDLRLLVTGMHLSPEFGQSVDEVTADGRAIAARIPSLVPGDTGAAIASSIGRAVSGFADELDRQRPDILVVYGDRHESFAAVCAAVPLRIPVAHIGGGENTIAVTTDVAYRAAMSKLSHLHFVSIPDYRDKVLRMGEEPWRIHVVGALAVDNVRTTPVLAWPGLATDLGLEAARATVVVTYHPVTMSPLAAQSELAALLEAISRLPDIQFVFTYPGADAGYAEIVQAIESYCAKNPKQHAQVVRNLGAVRYVNLLRNARAMLGNSSSGILEAPSIGLAVVNVGSRQADRVRARNVIDIPDVTADAIESNLRRALAQPRPAPDATYGDGHAADRIVNVLIQAPIDDALLRKELAYQVTAPS